MDRIKGHALRYSTYPKWNGGQAGGWRGCGQAGGAALNLQHRESQNTGISREFKSERRRMTEEVPNTIEKALSLNLDPLKYGTIIEIGAGQEVARWFFQAGAAAGTIAKTMSAYDMNFSDAIYGASSDKRYVSRKRLEKMLAQEYDLIISRIKNRRPDGSTFFAFANTVAAQSFEKREECHGWMGIRLQSAPELPPDDIVIHVRMLDDTNIEQQEALGVLGVNLIYGAYFYADEPERLMRSLLDNLKWGRVEIDLVEFSGPRFGTVDNRLMALELVKASLTPAILFGPDCKVEIPSEALYKKSVIAMRGKFNPVLKADMAQLNFVMERFVSQPDVPPGSVIPLAEITMSELANEGEIDTGDFLSRINQLSKLGFHVLISEFFRYFRVRQYLAMYSQEPVAIVTDVDGFQEIIHENYYDGLDGGILEGLGKLFPPATTAYVCPTNENGNLVTLDAMPLEDDLRPLVDYLRGRGHLISADDFDALAYDQDTPVLAAVS